MVMQDVVYGQQDQVLDEVRQELDRQLAKWGPQSHGPVEWMSILGEEYGEACTEANKMYWARSPDDWDRHRVALREELAHVAAVAVAAMEALERKYGSEPPPQSHK